MFSETLRLRLKLKTLTRHGITVAVAGSTKIRLGITVAGSTMRPLTRMGSMLVIMTILNTEMLVWVRLKLPLKVKTVTVTVMVKVKVKTLKKVVTYLVRLTVKKAKEIRLGLTVKTVMGIWLLLLLLLLLVWTWIRLGLQKVVAGSTKIGLGIRLRLAVWE
jgi:hypothetical protein